MAPKIFRIIRRIVIFVMICWLGNILWKNHTTPRYETPAAPPKAQSSSASTVTPTVTSDEAKIPGPSTPLTKTK